MIIDSISAIVISILARIISLLPDPDLSILTFVSSSSTTVRDMLSSINFAIDIYSLGLVLTLCILTEITILGVHVSQWILANVSVGFYHPSK